MGCAHCKIIEAKIAEAKIECEVVDALKDEESMNILLDAARTYHVKDVPFAIIEGEVVLYEQLLKYVNDKIDN